MKTAKEMFEELGYKLICSHLYPKKAKNYQFVYESEDNNPKRIEFRKCEDEVNLYISYQKLFDNIYDERMPINVLRAINKQCEELGWFDEN